MDRRTFVGTLTIAFLAAPLAAEEQAGKVWRIGFASALAREEAARCFKRWKRGLRELGYTPGQHIVFELCFAAGKIELLPESP